MITMSNFCRQEGDSDESSTEEDDDIGDDGPVTWDAEEDHLLSYFLGEAGSSNGGNTKIPALTQGHKQTVPPGKGMRMPSTPAVQFYATTKSSTAAVQPSQTQQLNHPGTQQQYPATIISNSSSGSSLSSMAATLVHGGPMLPQHQIHGAHTQPSISPDVYNATSPISPAAIIGNGQENLMLPPAPRYAVDNENQHHRQWLQQVNNMAMQVPSYLQAQQNNSNMLIQPPPYSQPQQVNSTATHMQTYSQPLRILPPGFGGYPLAPSYATSRPAPSVESEEKRAKRLARNRESARQSRKRKKEHLARLSNQVNQLQDALDEARRLSLAKMESALKTKRATVLAKLVHGGVINADILQQILHETSPNSPVKQAAIRFQYAALKQALLPNYEEFILWLTLKEEEFYTKGKDERAKADLNNRVASSGRSSSKQIGEELFKILQESEDGLECDADDLTKFWSMFCFEHSISVDQEDKLIQFYKRSIQNPNLYNNRLQMADAARMVTNMTKGMSFQSHAVGMRSDNTLLRTLAPEQTAKYLDWYANNKERCHRVLQCRVMTGKLGDSDGIKTMNDMCKRLDEALRLPATDTVDDGE